MKCKHFKIWEIVPKIMFEFYPEHKLWWLFDDRVLLTIDMLRDQYGKIVMNTWHSGGEYSERGFRVSNTETGAGLSQHKYGRAGDCILKDTPVGAVRQDCIDKRYECFKYITAIELDVSWFHFDVRCNDGELITFKK